MRAGVTLPDAGGVCVPVPSLKVYHSPVRPSSWQIASSPSSIVSMTPCPQPPGAGRGPEQANATTADIAQWRATNHDPKTLSRAARELIRNCGACSITRHGHRRSNLENMQATFLLMWTTFQKDEAKRDVRYT
jgi:hypothetical protein